MLIHRVVMHVNFDGEMTCCPYKAYLQKKTVHIIWTHLIGFSKTYWFLAKCNIRERFGISEVVISLR